MLVLVASARMVWEKNTIGWLVTGDWCWSCGRGKYCCQSGGTNKRTEWINQLARDRLVIGRGVAFTGRNARQPASCSWLDRYLCECVGLDWTGLRCQLFFSDQGLSAIKKKKRWKSVEAICIIKMVMNHDPSYLFTIQLSSYIFLAQNCTRLELAFLNYLSRILKPF